MKMKNLLVISFALFVSLSLSVGVNAQKKKVPPTKKALVFAKGTLSLEAGIVFNSGDVKPVARTQFYLLDGDLETILKESGIQPYMTFDTSNSNGVSGSISGLEGKRAAKKADTFVRSYGVWNGFPDIYGDEAIQSQTALKPHIISTITTDFNGKGDFVQVKAGNYNLVGVYRAGKQAILWSLPIEIKAGKQSLILDNNNATETY